MMVRFISFAILFCFILELSTIEAQECGKRKSEFGGEIAKRAEWPWNVALFHRQEEMFLIGGTLISDKHVLSAAHCFQQKNKPSVMSPFLVEAHLGKFNLSVKHETGSKSLSVWEIVIHPDWKFDDDKYDADLSIVVLERNVTFNNFIQLIRLPEQSDDPVTGTGTVVAWGRRETSAMVPLKLEVQAVNDSMCYTKSNQLERYYSTQVFCGDVKNLGQAPCLGDSGGGFFLLNQDEDFWEIRGVASESIIATENDCDVNKFALFTHVAKFTDWITKVMTATMTVDWKFVDFECVTDYSWTDCYTTFEGPISRNSKIRTVSSSHESKNSSIDVTDMNIYFSPSTHILSGIGEEFPNLRELTVRGYSIKFMERQNFANLTNLDTLKIAYTSVEFLPEDLLADLPNLTNLEIDECHQLKRFPQKFFANQRKLKILTLVFSGPTILEKDLFKNNLELEELNLWNNKLKEIYVDFTRLPAIRRIDLEVTECISQWWIPEIESIQSFQDKINRSCQPMISV